jgi:hypothetical protein
MANTHSIETKIAARYQELRVREAAARHLRQGSIVARQNASTIARLYDELNALHIARIEGVR